MQLCKIENSLHHPLALKVYFCKLIFPNKLKLIHNDKQYAGSAHSIRG